jgi:hypothetical protein
MGFDNDFAQPGMPAHIDIDRAVKGTYAALHTSGWIRNDLPRSENLPPCHFRSKQGTQAHNIYNSRFLSKKVTAGWRAK